MKKAKKIVLIGLILCALALSAWLYWERAFPLADVLPEEDWIRVQIDIGDPGVGQEPWQGTADPETVLTALEQAQVTRGPEFRSMSLPYFQLTLFKGESYPTHITVVANGQISVAVELDFDNYRYYEDNGELYAALLELTAG